MPVAVTRPARAVSGSGRLSRLPLAGLLIGAAIHVAHPAAAQQAAGHYYAVFGADDVLGWSASQQCFVSLRGACVGNVNRVNAFAIEHDGTLYCHERQTPSLSGPVEPIELGPNLVGFRCTLRGWLKARIN